jgi:uncharacterized protein (TIGR01615 family)
MLRFCRFIDAGASPGVPIIVDFQLRDHFEAGRVSDEYAAILAMLPSIFVGDTPHLQLLVTWLAERLADSFMTQGMPLPPWRTVAALRARWLQLSN